ncbi:FRAS1-related extracellular matrix protein 2-like isoform X2 [Dysidea avara]|uniref:FRAS1-related extracellular matrix protein 2-like isoform X2 n=1 Tax=Dysidea avara TaxID=196820 RepID=UPI003318F8ED
MALKRDKPPAKRPKTRKIGDRIVHTSQSPRDRALYSCKYDYYDHYLYIGTTYLFGIGGLCTHIKIWTPYSNFSLDLIQAIANGCSNCHVVSVTFQYNSLFIYESNSTVLFELLLSKPLPLDITVQVGVSNDTSYTSITTATEGVDFSSGPYNVIFPAGSTNASFSISITNDTIYESIAEYFHLIILKDSLPTCAQYDSSTFRVLILDDDIPINISFSKPSYTVKESLGQVHFELLLTGSYSDAIIAKVKSRDITAAGKGVDYTSGPYQVVFPPGVTRAPFNILINTDDILEGTESFQLIIKKSSLPTGIYLGEYGKCTVTIYN